MTIKSQNDPAFCPKLGQIFCLRSERPKSKPFNNQTIIDAPNFGALLKSECPKTSFHAKTSLEALSRLVKIVRTKTGLLEN